MIVIRGVLNEDEGIKAISSKSLFGGYILSCYSNGACRIDKPRPYNNAEYWKAVKSSCGRWWIVYKGNDHPENLPRNKPFPVANQGIKIPNTGTGVENKVVQKLVALNQSINPRVIHN